MLKSLARTWVRSSVMRKGLSGQSSFWAFIGILGALRMLKQRFAGKDTVPFMASQIRPGEVIELRYTGKPDRSVRKERRRREELAAAYATAASKRDRRRLGRRFAGTLIPEITHQRFGSPLAGALSDALSDGTRADHQQVADTGVSSAGSRRAAPPTS